MQQHSLFVNYSSPDDQQDRRRRREVASYIGTHYRNRSKPLRQREEQESRASGGTVQAQSSNKRNEQGTRHQWRLRRTDPSPLDMRDGTGLRDDPFGALPIRQTDRLPKAIDYFFHFYAPTHLSRPHLGSWSSPSQMLQDYFRFATQNGVMLEALVTVSFASMNAQTWQNNEPDFDTAYHYGSTLQRLRVELSDEAKLQDDGIFLAVLLLVRAEYILGNIGAYRAHKSALLNITRLRGGLDQLGWQNISRPGLTSMMSQCRFFASSGSDTLRTIGGWTEDYGAFCSSDTSLTPLYVPQGLETQTLTPGLQRLCNDGRISPHVAFLASMSLSYDFVDVKESPIVFNVDLVEHVEWTIANGGHSIEDEILLMTLHCTLYVLSGGERYSPLLLDINRYWSAKCLGWIVQVSPDDEALVEMFIWSCFKISGTLIAAYLHMQSTDPEDIRMKMMVALKFRFWQMQNWDTVRALLSKFNPKIECLDIYWKQVWDMIPYPKDPSAAID